MRRGGGFSVSVVGVYLIVGAIVAAVNDYFDNLDSGLRIGEAIVAIVIWPALLFGIDVELTK